MNKREMREGVRRVAGVALSAAAAMLAVGCGRSSGPGYAQIDRFQLGAEGATIDDGTLRICSGESVTASWTTRESIHNALIIAGRYQEVTLAGPWVEPAVSGTSTFRLDATGNAPAPDANLSSHIETAQPLRNGELTTIGGPSICLATGGPNDWRVDVPAVRSISGRVRVGRIFNTSGRDIVLWSNGESVPIPAGRDTTVFMGRPLSGPWTIEGDRSFMEACDTFGAPGPLLTVLAEIQC